MSDKQKKSFGERMKAARAAKKAQANVEATQPQPTPELVQPFQVPQPAATETPAEPPVVVEEANDPTKTPLISADGRVLEVSVNGVTWSGKTIYVPKEIEGEVRRLLEDGHFFLKN